MHLIVVTESAVYSKPEQNLKIVIKKYFYRT